MGKVYIGSNLLADTKETMLCAASDVGAVFMWGAYIPPKGCLLCDGSAYSREGYSQLFNVIGTTYGAGDGSTTFNVPDMRGSVPVGKDGTQTEFSILNRPAGANYKGEKAHVNTVAESGLRGHTHVLPLGTTYSPNGMGDVAARASENGTKDPNFRTGDVASATSYESTVLVGGDNAITAHNNLQPYRVFNFVIRYMPSINADKIGDTLPIGTMTGYVSDIVPSNWFLCNGQAISRLDYSELFSIIGASYGNGDGSTTFNIPDMRGRVAVGKDISQTEFDMLNTPNNYKGEKKHLLIAEENGLRQHGHLCNIVPNNTGGNCGGTQLGWLQGASNTAYSALDVASLDALQAHNNLQPYRVLNYIIKAKNTVPVEAVVDDYLTSTSSINALSANQGKALNDRLCSVEKSICCRAYHNTSQASSTGTYTYLSLNATSEDTDNIHDTQVNNSRLTVKTAGLYLIIGNVEFGMSNDTGIRAAVIRKNGTTVIASNVSGTVPLAIGYTTGTVSTVIKMNAGDYVELGIAQTSGTSLTIGQYLTTTFSIVNIA